MFPPLGSKPLATWFLSGTPGVNESSNVYLSLFVNPECSTAAIDSSKLVSLNWTVVKKITCEWTDAFPHGSQAYDGILD